MAISDEVFIIALGFVVNYILLYKRNKFLGNVIYLGLSFAITYTAFDPTNGTVELTTAMVGVILIFVTLFNLLWDGISKYNS